MVVSDMWWKIDVKTYNSLSFSNSTLRWLNPLTPSSNVVQRFQETNGTIFDICAVMLSHNLLDGFAGFIGVVEWDGANVVVKNVSLYNAVKELTTNETKFTIDGCSGSTNIVPGFRSVVRECWIGVLKEGDGNCSKLDKPIKIRECYLPNQWLTHKYGAKYQTAMLENP